MAVPSAITDLSGIPGNQQVELFWTAPNDGGAPIIDYIIQYKVASEGIYPSNTTYPSIDTYPTGAL